jgi:Alr-MurF fusion protein
MISLYDLIEASNGQLFGQPAAQLFDDFCLDADSVSENNLFVASWSEYGDTHPQIQQAIHNGAAGIICSQPPECDTHGVSVILVRDTTTALLSWAHYVLGKFGTKVIGVTGAAGKSTAMNAISQVLGIRYPVHMGLQRKAGRLSIPLSLAQLNPEHKFAILKLDARQPGEMAAMVQSIQPEIGVVTNIDPLHNHHFTSIEQVIKENRMLIEYLSPSGLAVLNYDDDAVRMMGSNTRAHVRTVGVNSFGASMMAYNLVNGLEGTHFDLRYSSERYIGQWVPLLGAHSLYSVLAALSVGLQYDIPLRDSLEALAALQPLPGHMKPLTGSNDCLLIDDTYNANPYSTLAALEWLQSIQNRRGRVFFVFADMENLGKNNQIAHRIVGQRAAEIADVLITQGAEAALTARAALDSGMDTQQVHITYTTRDVTAILANGYQLASDDLVLLKGGPSSRLGRVTQSLLTNPEQREQILRPATTRELVTLSRPTHLSWVDIDTAALAGNIRLVKARIGADVALMAVVKADAYGHGAVIAAQTALLNGASYLGVSSLQEAVDLRAAGINAPILAMNYIPAHMIRQAIQQNITVTIYDLEMARAYHHIAQEIGETLRAHIKIDSGMGRMGIMPDDTVTLFRHMGTMPHIEIEGVYTHFSSADENPEYTRQQIATFQNIIRPLQATGGIKFAYIHAANSAATIAHPESHFNLVRVGLAMYGMHPSDQVRLPEGFRPVMSWKTVIAQVKKLPEGHPVGYGNTYVTEEVKQVAVLPVGYADGFRRGPNNWGEVLVHGQRAPVIGRVSMEKTVIDVTHIPGAAIGDEVVLLGRQGDDIITAEEIASRLGTINYEVTCSILPRAPRR